MEVDFATKDEETFYRQLEKAVQLESLDLPDDELTEQAMFELILRLRQASVNPRLVVSGYRRKRLFPVNVRSSARLSSMGASKSAQIDGIMDAIGVPSKTRVLRDMIRGHRGEKAIVFCEFKEEMSYLQDDLAECNISSVCYDGSLSMQKRDEIVSCMKWSDQEIASAVKAIFGRDLPWEVIAQIASFISWDVILVQINSGNAGLNLQVCSKVYFTNINWSPCVEQQAVSRSHRMGQELQVRAVKLVLSGAPLGGGKKVAPTIDQRVLQIQCNKREIMADILADESLLFNGTTFQKPLLTDKSSPGKSDLSRQEMQFLLC